MNHIEELEKIERCKRFLIFLEQMHNMVEPRNIMNERHVEFARDTAELLTNYEKTIEVSASKPINGELPQ